LKSTCQSPLCFSSRARPELAELHFAAGDVVRVLTRAIEEGHAPPARAVALEPALLAAEQRRGEIAKLWRGLVNLKIDVGGLHLAELKLGVGVHPVPVVAGGEQLGEGDAVATALGPIAR
jgi:hypothetical protein